MKTRSELIRLRRQMHSRIRTVVAERRVTVAQSPSQPDPTVDDKVDAGGDRAEPAS